MITFEQRQQMAEVVTFLRKALEMHGCLTLTLLDNTYDPRPAPEI